MTLDVSLLVVVLSLLWRIHTFHKERWQRPLDDSYLSNTDKMRLLEIAETRTNQTVICSLGHVYP